ncbi:MAG: hypothetical protein QM759_15015 [Terricaulis sp.]
MGAETTSGLSSARKAPRWRVVGVFLAALSLLIQSFVVQPHIDGLAFVRADAAVHQTIKASPGDKAPGACIICQEAALAGAFALAATPTLLLIERTFIATPPARLQRVVCHAPSHIWQSRGPPQFV